MPRHWTLPSIPPHDFFLSLDVESYWDHEHQPELIYEEGFLRPLRLKNRGVLSRIRFNSDIEAPSFHIECSESLDEDEIKEANQQLSRILGTSLDCRPLYEMGANDPVLAPMLTEYYGHKRISRATLFEETVNRIVQMNLSHKPTARKMMYKVREKYGLSITGFGKNIACWPNPQEMQLASPEQIRACGPTVRKGEYIIRIAEGISQQEIDFDWLDSKADPDTFVNTLVKLKGIGPSAAQQLVLTRDRCDGSFPSTMQKGEERGLRRWIILAYGEDPDVMSNEEFDQLISNWKGYEAVAIEFLYLNWINEYKRKRKKSS